MSHQTLDHEPPAVDSTHPDHYEVTKDWQILIEDGRRGIFIYDLVPLICI